VEEMRDIVIQNFKPNVVNTIKLAGQMQLDVMHAREENQKF